ncbi:MAG: hypothetical protein EBV83_10830 [Verrucomicrobia bacterium]|nr:hypothetical protein [Verrucomicrobiota bacterium]
MKEFKTPTIKMLMETRLEIALLPPWHVHRRLDMFPTAPIAMMLWRPYTLELLKHVTALTMTAMVKLTKEFKLPTT